MNLLAVGCGSLVILTWTLSNPLSRLGAAPSFDIAAIDIAQDQADRPSTAALPEYRPQTPIVPRARLFGNSRGRTGNTLIFQALVPDHVGYTMAAQPALFWYLSNTTPHPVELTVIDTRSIQPILHITLRSPAQPGVQAIRLTEYGVSLEQNVQYRWFLSLVLDPDNPSRDLITGGVIERIMSDDGCELAAANSKDFAHCYANAGLWYDALSAVSERITAAPNERTFRKQRAALLRQIDLLDAAEWDLRQ